jgi:hypothetical protein
VALSLIAFVGGGLVGLALLIVRLSPAPPGRGVPSAATYSCSKARRC